MSMGMGGGGLGNGQWVRARNEEGAKALAEERQTDADRRRQSAERSAARVEAMLGRLRSLWRWARHR